MVFYLTKLVITAALIVLITEVAKYSDKFGGMIAALPVTTLLVILWMHFEGQPDQKISSHISYNLFCDPDPADVFAVSVCDLALRLLGCIHI